MSHIIWKRSVDDISISNCAPFSCSNFCFDWCQFFRSQFIRNGFNMLSRNNCLFDIITVHLKFFVLFRVSVKYYGSKYFWAEVPTLNFSWEIFSNGDMGYQCLMERPFQEGFSIFPIVLRLHLCPNSPTHLAQQISKNCINSES